MGKVKHYKLPPPPPDPRVVEAQEFAMSLPVEDYADMETFYPYGDELDPGCEVRDVHIKNDLFTLDITEMEHYCHANIELTVKGEKADIDDFGDWHDLAPENAPRWGCGCWGFEIWLAEDTNAMEKYGITKAEYYIIGQVLEKYLYVGCCDWCA